MHNYVFRIYNDMYYKYIKTVVTYSMHSILTTNWSPILHYIMLVYIIHYIHIFNYTNAVLLNFNISNLIIY